MLLHEITDYLEQKAPLNLQESYDNSGLIVGDGQMEVRAALICLDSTEEVVDEAIERGCNVIIAHHPIIFSGLKKLTGRSYIERVVMKAIRNNIAIYAIHTNLDNVTDGVNARIADRLGLKNLRILEPRTGHLYKLAVFVPSGHAADVMKALFVNGAGAIGQYDECSFSSAGKGTFRPGDGSNPFVGEKKKRHTEEEIKLEVILRSWDAQKAIESMIAAHPYEEVAYDLYPLKNADTETGSGMIGELEESLPVSTFFNLIKEKFECKVIRHTAICREEVKKVAICGGSGSFLLPQAIRSGADVFITADYKYHQFFDAEKKIIIADIGHFESERYTIDLLSSWLAEKFPNFALHKTGVVTNPIYYF